MKATIQDELSVATEFFSKLCFSAFACLVRLRLFDLLAGGAPGDAGKRRADAVYPRLIGMTGRALRLIDFLSGANIFTASVCSRR